MQKSKELNFNIYVFKITHYWISKQSWVRRCDEWNEKKYDELFERTQRFSLKQDWRLQGKFLVEFQSIKTSLNDASL